MVEAAGVEPASENIPHWHLHVYPDIKYSPVRVSIGQDAWKAILLDFRRSWNRNSYPTILQVVAQTGLAGLIRQDASLIRRLERIHNHLRLYLDPAVFTSWQVLDMQPEFLYPRRSRFAPNLSKNYRIAVRFYHTRLSPLFILYLQFNQNMPGCQSISWNGYGQNSMRRWMALIYLHRKGWSNISKKLK